MFKLKNKEKTSFPKRRLEDRVVRSETLIAPGTRLEGTVTGKTNIILAGFFQGDILSEGIVSITREGEVLGTIKARGLIIEGLINGNIESMGKVEVRAPARIVGDIRCSKIAIAEGCYLKGKIQMLRDQAPPLHFTEKRKKESDTD